MTTDLIGGHLGEFDVVRELGRGGMGVVYEAVQTSLGRRVAAEGARAEDSGLRRFTWPWIASAAKPRPAARLHHTNIVPVYATGEEHGVHFYAMEMIDGPALDAVVRQMREQANVTSTPAVSPDLTATTSHTPPDPLTNSTGIGVLRSIRRRIGSTALRA